jgi:hypothetical protein
MAEERERTGVLVVRAWMSQGSHSLLARITGRKNVQSDEETTTTVSGSEEAAETVRDWLRDFESGGDESDGDVAVTEA